MFFDPLYLIVLGVGALLSFGAQLWVKSKYNEWSQIGTRRGWSGREVAEAILRSRGIRDVKVEETPGLLSDHYDPSSKILRLSPEVYRGRSVASFGIAAHEVGHAIQHQQNYWPMAMRQKMVPVANIGSNLGVLLVIAGVVVGFSGLSTVGVLLFGGFVAFTLVTLPVEFDASARARRELAIAGLVTRDEARGVSEILTAAAATYLAAAATAIMQLLYWVMVARRT